MRKALLWLLWLWIAVAIVIAIAATVFAISVFNDAQSQVPSPAVPQG